MADKKNEFLMYKGRPLVRNGNTIYYGNMNEEYVIMLQIADHIKVKDLEVADRISVQLISTDTNLSPRNRIIRKTENNSARCFWFVFWVGSFSITKSLGYLSAMFF